MSYFPLVIVFTEDKNGDVGFVKEPREIPKGKTFTVVKTKATEEDYEVAKKVTKALD